jgi:hypothetical protein
MALILFGWVVLLELPHDFLSLEMASMIMISLAGHGRVKP